MDKKGFNFFNLVEIIFSFLIMVIVVATMFQSIDFKKYNVERDVTKLSHNIEYNELLREFLKRNVDLLSDSVNEDNYIAFYDSANIFFKDSFTELNWKLTIYENDNKLTTLWEKNSACSNSNQVSSIILPIKGKDTILRVNLFTQEQCI
tara:strand:+ start:154 stop:600 length:447 start_codon:yes stop_codon:yes gene_type:complete